MIPTTTRVPGTYITTDNSAANTAAQTGMPALIIAQGKATNPIIQQVFSGQETSLLGAGLPVTTMCTAFFSNAPDVPLYAIALPEDSSGTAATGTITFTGPAKANGALNFYIGGNIYNFVVQTGQTATQMATAFAAGLPKTLPVSAAAASGVVTLTASWKGDSGNDIPIACNIMPTDVSVDGITVTIAAMSGGAGIPDINEVLPLTMDSPFDVIMMHFNDAHTFMNVEVWMGDVVGRWRPENKLYGHLWTGKRDTAANLVTFGGAMNDQHMTVLGIEPTNPQCMWDVVASYAGAVAASLAVDPALPCQDLPMQNLMPSMRGSRFSWDERQSLLTNGIATYKVDNEVMAVERSITTYQKNSEGDADNSYLDVQTLFTTAYFERTLKTQIKQKYGNVKLSDTARPGTVTVDIIKGEIYAIYQMLEDQGILADAKQSLSTTTVVRNAQDPTRIDIVATPIYTSGWRITAITNKFSLTF